MRRNRVAAFGPHRPTAAQFAYSVDRDAKMRCVALRHSKSYKKCCPAYLIAFMFGLSLSSKNGFFFIVIFFFKVISQQILWVFAINRLAFGIVIPMKNLLDSKNYPNLGNTKLFFSYNKKKLIKS